MLMQAYDYRDNEDAFAKTSGEWLVWIVNHRNGRESLDLKKKINSALDKCYYSHVYKLLYNVQYRTWIMVGGDETVTLEISQHGGFGIGKPWTRCALEKAGVYHITFTLSHSWVSIDSMRER